MNAESKSLPSVLVVMTEQEKKEFVPPDLESKLRSMFPELTWVEAPLEEAEWHKLLRENMSTSCAVPSAS